MTARQQIVPFEPASPEERPGDVRREGSAAANIPFEPAVLRPRHDGWTAEKQIYFIETLAATKCIDEACRRVGMSDTSAYELRHRPCGKAFARAWDVALEHQLDRVEQCAVERAINGVARPIFHNGEQVGEWRHHDERLTMFLLRSRRAARYGKWVDQQPPGPPPEPDPLDHVRLTDALFDIALNAPERDGNELEDWGPEEESEDASE